EEDSTSRARAVRESFGGWIESQASSQGDKEAHQQAGARSLEEDRPAGGGIEAPRGGGGGERPGGVWCWSQKTTVSVGGVVRAEEPCCSREGLNPGLPSYRAMGCDEEGKEDRTGQIPEGVTSELSSPCRSLDRDLPCASQRGAEHGDKA